MKATHDAGGCEDVAATQRQARIVRKTPPTPTPSQRTLELPGLPRRPALRPGAAMACVRLGAVTRTALVVSPAGRGSFADQAHEVVAALCGVLSAGAAGRRLTVATVFLADPAHRPLCEGLLGEVLGDSAPLTHYVVQPPADGAALGLEAWIIAGAAVRLERPGAGILTVEHGGLRWVYVGGVEAVASTGSARAQTLEVLRGLQRRLKLARSGFEDVVRTWFYVGDINGRGRGGPRYAALNAARTEFFKQFEFSRACMTALPDQSVYPASTGIGMAGHGLSGGCMALQTDAACARLVALENPRQTPPCRYAPGYSPQSPKFARGMALVAGGHLTTWISGTASIVDSRSVFSGDIERQTRQTLDNIRDLIAPDNFARHGLRGCGPGLAGLAKVRVYLKRPEDYPRCRAICEQRLGALPAVYVQADICRPELLVEIEGVAFSPAPALASTRARS